MTGTDPAPQIEVRPAEDGTWNWVKVEAGKDADQGPGYDLRREAIEGAREHRGDETVNLVRQDGTSVGEARIGGGCRVVLMRLDGSEYGELDPPASTSKNPQIVILTPATEDSAAVNGDSVG